MHAKWGGSEKFVHDYWDHLKELCCGSPATSSQEQLEEVNYAEDGKILHNGTNNPEGVQETEVNDTSAATSTSDDSFQKPKAPIARLVDNKRKMLEKNLSANQRVQVFLNLAKDEMQLKQKLIDGLTEATKVRKHLTIYGCCWKVSGRWTSFTCNRPIKSSNPTNTTGICRIFTTQLSGSSIF